MRTFEYVCFEIASSKKTPTVKFLELIFRNNFLSSILANEICRGDFPPTSPNGLVLVAQTDFCVYRRKFLKKSDSS